MVAKKRNRVDTPVQETPGLLDSNVLPGLPRLDRVWVRVDVSHDGLLSGVVHEMALSERTAALIRCGYLEVVAPPDGAFG